MCINIIKEVTSGLTRIAYKQISTNLKNHMNMFKKYPGGAAAKSILLQSRNAYSCEINVRTKSAAAVFVLLLGEKVCVRRFLLIFSVLFTDG